MEKRNIHEDTKREKKDIGGSLYVFACVCVVCFAYLCAVNSKAQLKPISTERRPAICFGPMLQLR